MNRLFDITKSLYDFISQIELKKKIIENIFFILHLHIDKL
jgi:hypothetical protein